MGDGGGARGGECTRSVRSGSEIIMLGRRRNNGVLGLAIGVRLRLRWAEGSGPVVTSAGALAK